MGKKAGHIKGFTIFKNKGLGLGWAFFFLLCFSSSANCQLYSSYEENFAYKVKQIDEFFERFNDEGTIIKSYLFSHYDRMEVSRDALLKSLFDLNSAQLNKEEVLRFIQLINDPEKPVSLSFYDDNWYAKVKCKVVYEKQKKDLYLLLRVQKERNGASKWVVQDVYASFLAAPESHDPYASLNPASHATDFMGLSRVFEDPENLKAYFSSGYQDNQLSKFAMEMQKKRIGFEYVENISYHFLQVDGWIFTVEHFPRQEKNSGWLISWLLPADEKDKEEYLKKILSKQI